MIPENATLFLISLLGKGIHEKTPCDVTACRSEYIRTAFGSEGVCLSIRTTWEFRLQCELEAGELSAIESAVIVVIRDLLTVCVAKSESAELLLPVNCCLSTLLICAISIVTCATCYPAHL
ncbi:hypothetical protein AVEN_152910-1 [Araneus ventricosus]|uniref:Uncharacterized protein n=1 Tax=Araneus ventricosus TaxID=182803 RepID=A0A4Y2AEN6_ARAVE|nr:hypothetical protein AVEN_152910-1 [Araneus ventricosus]